MTPLPQPPSTCAAGTYDEQVVIDKSLTLQGAGDSTVVQPSSADMLTQNFTIPWYTGTKQVAGIIVADEAGNGSVAVKNLKVDGENVTACPTGANWVAGVLYRETGGTIDNLTVTNLTIGTTGTAVRGQGILLSAVAIPTSVEVMECDLSNYDKNGITAIGNQLTADIHDNFVTGRGTTLEGDEVQNGVVIIHDAQATVNKNVVSDHAYIGTPTGDWAATGILFCNAEGSAQDNTSTNNEMGVVAQILEGFGGVVKTVTFKTNTASAVGLSDPALTVSGLNAATYADGAALTITMDGNNLTAGGPGDGISIGDIEGNGPSGSVIFDITNNTISDWQEGIHLLSSVAAGSTITGNTIANNISGASGIHLEAAVDATNVSVNDNDIAGNWDYGVYNGGIGTLDATNNWWGHDSGPKDLVGGNEVPPCTDDPTTEVNADGLGDEVSDNIDYCPWLVASVEKATETATGKGPATFTVDNGTITGLTAVDEATLPLAGKPSGVTFPNGLFSFNITGIAPARHCYCNHYSAISRPCRHAILEVPGRNLDKLYSTFR